MTLTKKILQRLFLIFFSLIVTFLILEFILRVVLGDSPRKKFDLDSNDQPISFIEDKIIGWKPKPGKHSFLPWSEEGKQTELTILNDGSRFSGQNNDYEKEKIVFIGGSLTQGQAVDDSETFSWMLQKKIKDYEIKNYGAGGYGGTQSLLKLKDIFKKHNDIKLVVYGFISHHEIRNIAAGSWMYLLKKNSSGTGGKVSLPFASIENNNLKIHKPKKYFEIPFGDKSALIAKIEKRILKIESYKRSLKKDEISKRIILNMNSISKINGSEFISLFLNVNELPTKQFDYYIRFLKENRIKFIKCQFPIGEDFIVKGEGHPNKSGHKSISDCVFNKLTSVFNKL